MGFILARLVYKESSGQILGDLLDLKISNLVLVSQILVLYVVHFEREKDF